MGLPQNGKQHWQIILNKSSVKYLNLNFCEYQLLMQKGLRTLSTMFYIFFCTLSTQRNTVHFNYVPSVLELELCIGWKCTWCFVTVDFGFIFIYVHFLKAFCYIESIKSCLLPFLSNLYCTSIKRPTSINFQIPEGGRLIEVGLYYYLCFTFHPLKIHVCV